MVLAGERAGFPALAPVGSRHILAVEAEDEATRGVLESYREKGIRGEITLAAGLEIPALAAVSRAKGSGKFADDPAIIRIGESEIEEDDVFRELVGIPAGATVGGAKDDAVFAGGAGLLRVDRDHFQQSRS